MSRSAYRGAVRDGDAETARDARMLALFNQGVTVTIIAHRMGVTVNSVRLRIKRAREAQAAAAGRHEAAKAERDLCGDHPDLA